MEAKSKTIEAALGKQPLDLLIEDVRLVNVYTGEIYPADIGISNGYIVYIGAPGWTGLEPQSRIPAKGKFAVPGLIDAHVHIESSMMSPAGFAAAVLPHGTTTVTIDPHEVANVMGMRGVQYMLEATANLPLRVYVQVPSCVPAVPALETAGAEFGPHEVAEMLTWDRVIGVAEVMDYVGVINQSDRMRAILDVALANGTVINGHCPSLRGHELAAYLVAGPNSDHEGTDREELLEKLRFGMTIEARVSTFSESVSVLGDIVQQLKTLPPNLVMCTDDILPEDLLRTGHLDNVVRSAIAAGFPAVDAVCAATLNGAQRHRLYDLGAITPGKRADILLLQGLDDFSVDEVFVNGLLVAQAGHMVVTLPNIQTELECENSIHLPHPPQREDFVLHARPGHKRERVRVMVNRPDGTMDLEIMELPVRKGTVDLMPTPEVCLVAVLERHGRRGHRGLALVKGLKLKQGAVASTVAHDSHNLLVLGRNPEDMAIAAQELAACGGGICCVRKVLALLPLRIAGLMSPLPLDELVPLVQRLHKALRSVGMEFERPLSIILGLALPVIPHYSVTDMGLVDVDKQEIIPLWADEE